MANLFLHGAALSDSLKINLLNSYAIEPFIGGGFGIGFNNMSNFYSVRTSGVYTSIAQDNFRTSFV